MDIVRAKLTDLDQAIRDEGVYVILATGRLIWRESGTGWEPSTWQAHGTLLRLMDGPRLLAECKLEVPPAQAEERGELIAAEIEPWAESLRHLTGVRDLREALQRADLLRQEVLTELDFELLPSDELIDRIAAYSTPADALAVKEEVGPGPREGFHYTLLLDVVMKRLRREVAQGQRIALALAPPFGDISIHPAWVMPASIGQQEEPLAQAVAQELLMGWRDAQNLRDPLVTWSIHEAGLTRGRVQELSGISRTTINRLLPTAD
ncbi:hypothetical protein [Streptomyces sp. NPDC058861]|uniref:hypothetical protein n=1 Tax=Streptomyces sp. NPDC058861 TaxID=3346653 RepID=UPI00369C1E75